MDQIGEGIRKLILAGIGAAAMTKEKSEGILQELVKKGELTVEQGKVLNEELKHDLKQAIRENVTVNVVRPQAEDVMQAVDHMDDEALEALGTGALRKAVVEGDLEEGCFLSGQVAAMVKQVQPAADIVREVMEGAEPVLKGATKWVK